MEDAPREGFRLSPQQKHLWTLQQNATDRPYRVIGALRLNGVVDCARLKECLAEVVARHEILRTTFVRPPGVKTAFQVVSETPQFSWTEQQVRVDEYFDEERKHTLDFERGPLLRAGCFRLAEDQHVLVVSLPAMCADQATLWNLADELVQVYEGDQPGESIQYADFAEWQTTLLAADDKVAAQANAYWKQQPETVNRFEQASTTAFEPESIAFDIGKDLLKRVEVLAQRYDTHPSVVLFACWQALQWRLNGQSDFVVWNLNQGRKLEDLRSAMGLYARYLPVVCDGGDWSFTDYLKHSKAALAQTEEWQEYFDPGAGEDHTAGIVAFDFQTVPGERRGSTLSCSLGKQFVCIHPFRIKLAFFSDGGTLHAAVEYNRTALERESAQRIAGYYARLLAGVLQEPETSIGAINILDADEQRHLVYELNETDAAYPDRCIHQLFEEQVRKTPAAPAVACGDKRLTYSQLNKRANQVAHVLRQRGVGPETPVALCMGRSVEMIAGLLGILKAGGAYVPLNPDHPASRLENQLAQSQATICLVNNNRIENTVDQIDLSILDNEADTNLDTATTSDNLVYVIFTSGSTGVPKGVSVRHRNLVNYSRYILDKLSIDEPLNFATVSTITADLGNTCIFPSLVSGGCLHILDDETAMEGNLLARYISDNSIDVLKIVPSHLNALLAATEDNVLPAKYLLLGGESLSWDLVKRLSSVEHTCKIINHYGPTETTVGSLTYNIEGETASLTVPIGRPIANTRVYLLDKYVMPVPQGVSGELFIGGAGVTDGYRNQPAETAARFLPDPFSLQPGARLYKTGDLARQLPDGSIEFIGRADRQVKVRGYRIELAEIEKVLEEQSGVSQAVVVVRGDDNNQQLVAYIVASGTKRPGHDEIRTSLTKKLPGYMIPSTFVFLEAFPLTPNGKLDRAALPAPEHARPELERVFVAPRTASEKEIAEICTTVLKLDEVGIHDDFFELGGHSLLATQVVARVRKAFQFDIPLRSIFETPTIAQLAERIDRETEAEMSELLTALEALSDEEAQDVLAMERAKDGKDDR